MVSPAFPHLHHQFFAEEQQPATIEIDDRTASVAKAETRTADFGGTASTAEVAEALVAQLR